MTRPKEFSMVNIIHQKRFKNKGFKKKMNNGLDTETYNGYVKLICDDKGRYSYIDNFDDIIRFLSHADYLGKYNWFYNINFDFQSMVKHLDIDLLKELYDNKRITIGRKTIQYLDRKFFAISDDEHNYYYFYDLFNFLDTSLDKASKKFLGDTKLKIIDASRLNIDIEYWNKNSNDIIRYCIKDANLTKRLADYFWDIIYTNLKFYPKRPFSKGKLSEEYFLSKCYIPTINDIDIEVIRYAYESYYGGRFEILQRGYYENVFNYDIASAYPAQIANLIDFNRGKWYKVNKKFGDTEYGWYEVKVNCKEVYFSPFRKKISELNIYPNGKFRQYMSRNEIDFILENFENVDIEILSGYEFYPDQLCYPFRDEILKLYEWKEKEKDDDIKYAVKIILNSLYGKTIQIVGDDFRTGKLFNPMYASLITSGCRIKLLSTALQKPDCVVSFSTDSIVTTEKLKVPNKKALGEFTLDYEGEGVFVMSDVYNIWNDDNPKDKNKNRLRGFAFTKEKDYDDNTILLKDILKNMYDTTKYVYYTKRPYHLGECLIHTKKKNKEMINVFYDVRKEVDINGDNKRLWDREFKNGVDALKNQIKSMPLFIGR